MKCERGHKDCGQTRESLGSLVGLRLGKADATEPYKKHELPSCVVARGARTG